MSSRSLSLSRSGPKVGMADWVSFVDLFHFVLLVALDALARVHDLDREQILVLLHAVDRLAGRAA